MSEKIWSALAQAKAIHAFEVRWRELDWPIDWERTFGRAGALRLEIGFGNGAFMHEQAMNHPDANYVGIEISWNSIARLLKRLHKDEFTNGRVIDLPGRLALEQLIRPGSLDHVYINHPDPWQKDKHFRRVLVQPELLKLLASRLRPGGKVTIATDHVRYAGWIKKVLEGQQELVSVFDESMVHSLPGRTPTKYEKKFLDKGQPIHYFVWQLPESATASTAESPKTSPSGDMPNILFNAPPENDFRLAFSPSTVTETYEGLDYVIKFMRCYRQTDSDNQLVEVLVIEGELTQQFGVVLLPRDGQLLVKVAQLGSPRPTHAVKKAVWLIARTIKEQHPELSVHSNTIHPLE